MNTLAHHDFGEETIDLLQRLIALASVNDLTPDSGNEEAAAHLFETFFAGLPVEVERIEPHPGRTTLVVTLRGSDPSAQPLTFLGTPMSSLLMRSTGPIRPLQVRSVREVFGGEEASICFT